MNSKKKPQFRRTQGHMYTKLKGKGWRRPTGKHNKIKDCKKGKGFAPRIGYGAKKDERYLHPCGLEDRLVASLKDANTLDPKKQAARISGSVGKRKKALLHEELKKLKVKILN